MLTVTIPNVVLRPAEGADEDFLLNLRMVTMTEHLERVGIKLDIQGHAERATARDRWHNVHGGAMTASNVGFRRR